MADDLMFSAQELKIDEGLGYPKAYAKLCRDRGFGPYSHGPPFTFTPYALQPYQDSRAKELDWMFPIVDPKAKPSARPKIFVSILWKQLNHLGNAGFDPETFRIDPYGNVLYIHADSASPLAWDIDHWFPCSRGGLTVSSNLRLLQWQVCKKKHNKLEFLVPWWDLQVGISVNQHRGFYLLFSNGENEELNASQTVESHCFPQPFNESWKKSGLAPAAVVVSRKESNDALLALQSIDINRRHTMNSPIENEVPEMVTNPYQAMVVARDSLRQQEETVKKQAEIEKLDEEVVQLKQKNEEERTSIQDLELLLIKKRRRAEKCRRLESQKAMCDSSERELHKKFRHRDELEKQIRPEWEQIRKRSRTDDDALCDGKDDKMILYLKPESNNNEELPVDNAMEVALLQEKDENTLLCLPEVGSAHKQLRVFLEEEHKASEAEQEDGNEIEIEKKNESCEGENGKKPQKLQIEEKGIMYDIRFPVDDAELVGKEEDEESRKQRGKGNVEKWLQLLLDEGTTDQNTEIRGLDASKTEEIIRKMNAKYPQKEILNEEETPEVELEEATKEMKKEILQKEETHEVELEETTKKILKNPPYKIISVKTRELECEKGVGGSRRKSFEVKEKSEKIGKFKDIARSESARMLRRIPSSPSIILGMKKGVDCIRRKPAVKGDDEDYAANSSFIKSSYKVIKKAVKI
ncbi:hypothetical protein Ccrd_023767 [Cynara cardunculus var. scolymus]|uniref:Uncharacterized protein n=1 Tax=Cynara cardunculus var. scolymus TaxID=59895 RepID=A0A118JY35_CYNCS|nr:hypothetical protein Ccrd_023767 [Cynara cardunculus var. scolymus]